MEQTTTIDAEAKRPTDPAMIDWAKELCYTVAPELHGTPLYLIDHPPTLPATDAAAAYAVIGRHIELHDWLVERGEYSGPGPIIVLVDAGAPEPESDDRRGFAGLILHELAHVVPYTPLPWIEPSPAQREWQQAWVAAWSRDEIPEPEPWWGHGLDFIRRAMHLHYRTLWTSLAIPLGWMNAAGGKYCLSPPDKYLEALGAEPFQLRTRTFAEIDAHPAPQAFTELFARDVAAWKSNNKQGEKST